MASNQHGLSRHIPEEIKYQIRKSTGFGCASCGMAIGQYEHIDPEFADARGHDPASMTYLCGRCHDKVSRNFVSKATVWNWKRQPWCLRHGKCHESFDVGTDSFALWFCQMKVVGVHDILTYNGECILRIKPPEAIGAPYRLSAKFCDDSNNETLEIVDNEWFALSSAFDVVCVKGKIGIRTPRGFALKISCFPPNALAIDQIDMFYDGLRIRSECDALIVEGPQGGQANCAGRLIHSDSDYSSLFSFSSDSTGLTLGPNVSIAPLTEARPLLPVRAHSCRQNQKCPCGSGRKYKKCCYPRYDFEL